MQLLRSNKFLVMAAALFFSFFSAAQHPAREKIDSLKSELPGRQDRARIDCLNALSEEYWWPPRVWPDSIAIWANDAYKESAGIGYAKGIAESSLHLGVADIYRKNFLSAEKHIHEALRIFTELNDIRGLGWANLWLGQTLYSENNFSEASSYILQSLPYLHSLNNWEGEGKAWAWMSFLHAATGNYDSSFEYCNKSLEIRKKMSDNVCVAASLANMGYLYKSAGDYEDALDYYKQGMQYAKLHGINYYAANWNYFDEPIGAIYQLMHNPDSSLLYLQRAMQIDPANQMTRISFGETLLLTKQYDAALAIFIKPISHLRQENDLWDLMRILPDAARALLAMKNERSALIYAREGFQLASKAGIKPYMIQGYWLLSKINEALKKKDSAYTLMQQFVSLRDSVTSNQFIWRLTNYKKQTDFKNKVQELTILNQENKLKEDKLKQAGLVKWLLLAGLLVTITAAFFILRNFSLARKFEQLENQQMNSELQLKANDLELQALRAQINPHFIFNCLSSINRFVLKNEKTVASDYLTRFSRLIRMVLTNSSKSLISLRDELAMLSLYLEMENLRFNHAFDYAINIEPIGQQAVIQLPPMLLQPFVENSIWHGLMHKEGPGKLTIFVNISNNMLQCVIEDDGVGRAKSGILKDQRHNEGKSLGLKITAERLALLKRPGDHQTGYTIEDIQDSDSNICGTRAVITLPLIYAGEQDAGSQDQTFNYANRYNS